MRLALTLTPGNVLALVGVCVMGLAGLIGLVLFWFSREE